MKAIIACNNLGFIGKGNGMLWRSKEDFKHFKALTTEEGKEPNLLVGYNTATELPPLKGRNVIVDYRERYFFREDSEIDWCIGGKKTYQKYCSRFTELHISHINDNSIGDVTFPDLSDLSPDCKIFNYFFEVNTQ